MVFPNSPLCRWCKRLVWLVLSLVILTLGALVIVNVIDYRRYRLATHFEESVSLAEVRELAQTCFDLGKNGYVKLTKYPDNIARLKPRWVSIESNHAQISLYANGEDAAVFLTFEKTDENESVEMCDYVYGFSDAREVWVRDQAAYDFLHPKGRVVTLAQGTMHEYIEWIVLPDEVRVIVRPGSGGAIVLGRRTITAEEKRAVERTAKAIPAVVRGKHFQSGIIDGIHLFVLFAGDGRRGPDDIELDNTWREEAGPLVDLVEQLSPKGNELKFRSIVEQEIKEYPRSQSAVAWSEQAKFDKPRLTWWCIWPRLMRSN